MSKRDVRRLVLDRIGAQNPPAKGLKLSFSPDARQQHAMLLKRLGVSEPECDGHSFSGAKPRSEYGGVKIAELILSAESNVNRNESGLNWVK